MALITSEYRSQLRQLHAQRADFGKGGSRWAAPVMLLAKRLGTDDVLDYGCGKGVLNLHMPWHIKGYDPGVIKHALLPDSADIVVCTDVLEHIEPEKLDEVLTHLFSLARKALVLNINHQPAAKKLPDGRNAHLIQEDSGWWLGKFPSSDVWHVVDFDEREIPQMPDKVYDTTWIMERRA